jgi:hypothetical protein
MELLVLSGILDGIFSGISIGSVLLLVALGLAIVWGAGWCAISMSDRWRRCCPLGARWIVSRRANFECIRGWFFSMVAAGLTSELSNDVIQQFLAI